MPRGPGGPKATTYVADDLDHLVVDLHLPLRDCARLAAVWELNLVLDEQVPAVRGLRIAPGPAIVGGPSAKHVLGVRGRDEVVVIATVLALCSRR